MVALTIERLGHISAVLSDKLAAHGTPHADQALGNSGPRLSDILSNNKALGIMKSAATRAALSLVSVIASVAFCALGLGLFLGASSSGSWLVGVASVVLLAYGVVSLGLLITAWSAPNPRIRSWSRVLAAVAFLVWLVGSLDSGGFSGHETLALFGVTLLIGINIASITVVTNAAQQQVQGPTSPPSAGPRP